jgi:hypothetical protein
MQWLDRRSEVSDLWPALAKGGFWGQILKMSCWYGQILHTIIFKMMYDTWQSLDNSLRYGLQNTSFFQVFGYNYFEKTLLEPTLSMKSIRNSNVSAVLLDYSGLQHIWTNSIFFFYFAPFSPFSICDFCLLLPEQVTFVEDYCLWCRTNYLRWNTTSYWLDRWSNESQVMCPRSQNLTRYRTNAR